MGLKVDLSGADLTEARLHGAELSDETRARLAFLRLIRTAAHEAAS